MNEQYDRKYVLRAGIVFLLYLLVSTEWPYSHFTLIDFFFRPIGIGNGFLFLGGLVPLGALILISIDLAKSNYVTLRPFFIFLILIVVVLPLGQDVANATRNTFYRLNDNVKSIQILSSDLSYRSLQDLEYIQVDLKLKAYKKVDQLEIELILEDDLDLGRYLSTEPMQEMSLNQSQDRSQDRSREIDTLYPSETRTIVLTYELINAPEDITEDLWSTLYYDIYHIKLQTPEESQLFTRFDW